jgi:hypothetical protein
VPDFPFKWAAEFVASDQRVRIEVESDTYNRPEQRHISFTGEIGGHMGQCDEAIRAAVEGVAEAGPVRDILDAWSALHLKPIVGLDALQLAALDEVQVNLILVNGERYGSAASFEDLGDAEFSNGSEIIDSRDVIKRIEELTGAFEAAGLDPAKLDPPAADYDDQGLAEDDPAHDRAVELAKLKALEDEAEDCSDWNHGETLIRESYFRQYAEQFADDIGAIDAEAKWPLNHIDWDAAAEELKSDYTEVDFDGVAYLIRS